MGKSKCLWVIPLKQLKHSLALAICNYSACSLGATIALGFAL